jgi:hypothetical protein
MGFVVGNPLNVRALGGKMCVTNIAIDKRDTLSFI